MLLVPGRLVVLVVLDVDVFVAGVLGVGGDTTLVPVPVPGVVGVVLDEVVDDVPVELVPEDPPPHAVSANSDAKSRGSCLMGEYLGCCSCGARTMSVYCGENVKSP